MRKKKKTEVRQATEFAVLLFIGATCIAGWLFYKGDPIAPYVAGASLGPLFLAFVVRPAWLVLFRLWMKLGEAMGFVMTRVILSVFYFGFLTPIAVVMRLIGKNPLDVKWKDEKATYWRDKESSERTPERYSKLY